MTKYKYCSDCGGKIPDDSFCNCERKRTVTKEEIQNLLALLIDKGPLWYRGPLPEEGRAVEIIKNWLHSIGLGVRK